MSGRSRPGADRAIDVVLASDRRQFAGVIAVMRSLTLNTGRPEAVSFHVLTGPAESDELAGRLKSAFPSPAFRYRIREFLPPRVLQRYIGQAGGLPPTGIPHEADAINCSRFYLPTLFPELDEIVYLDADVVVQGDVAELLRAADLDRHELAAVAVDGWEVYIDKDSAHLREIDLGRPGFNAGVFAASLTGWRRGGVTERIEDWLRLWTRVREEGGRPPFHFGSQAVMILVFHRRFRTLERRWNVWGLGFGDELDAAELEGAAILHWTGPAKPWKPDGLYKEYWERYAEPSAGGTS